jgi:hypothetical protein
LASEAVVGDINSTLPDTPVLAKKWIQANLPPRGAIARDAYSAPLDAERFRVMQTFSASYALPGIDEQQGTEYLDTSSARYNRLVADADW